MRPSNRTVIIGAVILFSLLLCIVGGVWAGTQSDLDGQRLKLLAAELLLTCLIAVALYVGWLAVYRATFCSDLDRLVGRC